MSSGDSPSSRGSQQHAPRSRACSGWWRGKAREGGRGEEGEEGEEREGGGEKEGGGRGDEEGRREGGGEGGRERKTQTEGRIEFRAPQFQSTVAPETGVPGI